MFCVYDCHEQIIAFHDYLDVVESYVDHIKEYHNDVELHIGKIKRKKVSKLIGFDDLYLVRYGETYVQEGYIGYLSIVSDQVIHDTKLAKEVLLRIIENDYLSKKEISYLKHAIMIIDRELEDCESFTPTLDMLRQIKMDYDPYIYNYNSYP